MYFRNIYLIHAPRLLMCIMLLSFALLTNPLPVAAAQVSETDSLILALKKQNKPEEKNKTFENLMRTYLIDSKLDKAFATADQWFAYLTKHGTATDSARYYRLTGLAYGQKAFYDKALGNYMKSQLLFGQTHDTSMQANVLMNIGIIHDNLSNYSLALHYYNKALGMYESIKKESGVANCLMNTAIVYTKQEKYAAACQNLEKAAQLYKKTENKVYEAGAYSNLGATYKKMKKYDLAVEYAEKSFVIWKSLNDEYHISHYYLNMGEIMLDLKKTDEAGTYLHHAVDYATRIGAKDIQAQVYDSYAKYLSLSNQHKTAYEYLRKSKQINDSLLSAETTEKINQIQYQYEIVRREAENNKLIKQNQANELKISRKDLSIYILAISLLVIAVFVGMLLRHLRSKRRINARLEEQNKLIESQRDELIKLNASKDKFLSILAHDIKNPLSSIYGISDLLVNDYESLNDDEKKVFTRDIHTLSGNLFEIINTLLAWSSSQSGLISYHPSEFNINTLTDKVIHLLETIAKQKDIRLVNDTQPGLQVKADENMINSVLFNLIANSIKFSYKNSEIRVTASEISGMVHMAVIDTGQGLSPENQAKLFRYDQHYLGKGTAGESGTGLGLILCKDFVEKNGGTISVKSEPGKGSTFTFTLAAAEK